VKPLIDWLIDWSCWWGETTSLNCGHQQAYCSSPRWYMRTMEEWYWQRNTPDSSTRALWQSYQQSSTSKQEEQAKEVMNFGLLFLFILPKWFFTCHKILWHGTSGFTSHLVEGTLRTFITFKNPSPWPGLNLRTLGLVAYMLNITLLRWPFLFTVGNFI
jgi:hypothetical protein